MNQIETEFQGSIQEYHLDLAINSFIKKYQERPTSISVSYLTATDMREMRHVSEHICQTTKLSELKLMTPLGTLPINVNLREHGPYIRVQGYTQRERIDDNMLTQPVRITRLTCALFTAVESQPGLLGTVADVLHTDEEAIRTEIGMLEQDSWGIHA